MTIKAQIILALSIAFLLGNSSVGDEYYSEITPEGIVREVSHDYSVFLHSQECTANSSSNSKPSPRAKPK